MASEISCLLCKANVTELGHDGNYFTQLTARDFSYYCPCCSYVLLTTSAASVVESYSDKDRLAISIYLRNEWERTERRIPDQTKSTDDLKKIIEQYRPLGSLEMVDNALQNIENTLPQIGAFIPVSAEIDYPYYRCKNRDELIGLFILLYNSGYITASNPRAPHLNAEMLPKGYQRLCEIQRPNQESRQAFVAMWFNDDMKDAYDQAIEPAIQYVEQGESNPKFKALRIDNKEHVNDINDQIIAEIRRSRFMVCDLTGYRGGVYFEAGFAYGLGIPVIYTCRKDWTKPEALKDKNGNEIKELYDGNGQSVRVGKEGVHFDLNHRNRIEWDSDNLDDFRIKLERRIKAVIY